MPIFDLCIVSTAGSATTPQASRLCSFSVHTYMLRPEGILSLRTYDTATETVKEDPRGVVMHNSWKPHAPDVFQLRQVVAYLQCGKHLTRSILRD
jgi:hypothetical protein